MIRMDVERLMRSEQNFQKFLKNASDAQLAELNDGLLAISNNIVRMATEVHAEYKGRNKL